MKKVILLFLSCATVITSFELVSPSLNPVFADTTQDSGDRLRWAIDSPNIANVPSAGNSASGLAEKGKPILDHNSVTCPQILKTDNGSNKSSENTNISLEGKGQVPSFCLHQVN